MMERPVPFCATESLIAVRQMMRSAAEVIGIIYNQYKLKRYSKKIIDVDKADMPKCTSTIWHKQNQNSQHKNTFMQLCCLRNKLSPTESMHF